MKRLIVFLIALAVCATAKAATPQLVDYQGYLMESGAAVTGTKSITFTLYDSATGGAQLCTSGAQSVTVTAGVFSYRIGSAGCNLSTVNWDNPVYLELRVESTTLSPREQIAGAAYSVQTKAVNVVFTPAGNVASTNVQNAIAELDTEKLDKTGGTITGTLAVTGNLNASGTVTATNLSGDGTSVTNVTPKDSSVTSAKVADNSLTAADLNVNVVSSVDGVTSDGGNIDIVAGSGITVTPDDAANAITFAADVSVVDHNSLANLTTGDPHTQYAKKAGDTLTGDLNMGTHDITNAGTVAATNLSGDGTSVTNVTPKDDSVTSAKVADGTLTAADLSVNVVSSVDGVTNDGGDVDLIAGNGITITPDDTANTITLTADVSAVDHNSLANLTTGDPHTQYAKKAGDTLTGDLNMGTHDITNAGTVAATGFSGDGTSVTNVTPKDDSVTSAKVADGTLTAADLSVNVVSSVDGVTNDGGDVDLIAGNGITITPDDTANTITLTADVSAVDHNSLANLTTGDPHTQYAKKAGDTLAGDLNMGTYNITNAGTVTASSLSGDGTSVTNVTPKDDSVTSAKVADGTLTATDLSVNVVSSVDGVTNDGGDVDLIAGNGITITPDDTANTITLTADVSAVDHNSLANLTAGDPHTQYAKKAGDTLTGDLNMGTHNITNAGTVTATGFSGDGTSVTNVTPKDDSVTSAKVADGTLTAADLNVNVVSSVDGVTNDGGDIDLVAGTGVTITPNDGANTVTIAADMGSIDHGSIAGLGDDDHTQYVKDAGDTMTGTLAMSTASGDITFDNSGGDITLAGGGISDSAGNVNLNDNVYVNGNVGIGTSSPSTTLEVAGTVTATGGAGNGVYASTTGAGPIAGVYGYTSGTSAYGVRGTNAGGSGYGIMGESTGSGSAIYGFQNSSGNVFAGNHTGGGGNLIQMQAGGVDTFVVDRSGNVTAAGIISGSGVNASTLDTMDSTDFVAAAGDTMTGALAMSTASGDITFDNAGGDITLAGGSISDSAGSVNINDNMSVSGTITGTASSAGTAVTFNQTGAGNLFSLQSGGSDTVVVDNIGTVTFTRTSGNAYINLKATGGNSQSGIGFFDSSGTTLWGVYNDINADNTQNFSIRDQVAGAERLTINPSGYVGVGTTSPKAKLDVAGNITASGTVSIGSDTGSDGYDVNFYGTYSAATGGRMYWDASKDAFRAGRDTGSYWSDATTGQYSFAAGYNTTASGGGATAMGGSTIASGSGSTAIGGNAAATGNYSVVAGQYINAQGTNSMVLGQGVADGIRLVNNTASSLMVGFNSNIPTLYVGPSSGSGTTGNVGIGTSSPSTALHVKSGAASSVVTIDSGTGAGQLSEVMFSDNGIAKWSLIKDSANGFDLTEEGVLMGRLHVLPGGDIGLGTVAPSANLHIYESSAGTSPGFIADDLVLLERGGNAVLQLFVPAAYDAAIGFSSPTGRNRGMISYSNSTEKMTFKTAATSRLYIDNAGNVGINKAAPTEKLDVTGNIKASGVVTSGCPSGMSDMGNFCIDTNEESGTPDFWTATNTCRAANKQLCSLAQWQSACSTGTPNNMTDNWEITDEVVFNAGSVVVVMGDGSCTSYSYSLFGDTRAFRCCYSK